MGEKITSPSKSSTTSYPIDDETFVFKRPETEGRKFIFGIFTNVKGKPKPLEVNALTEEERSAWILALGYAIGGGREKYEAELRAIAEKKSREASPCYTGPNQDCTGGVCGIM